MKKKVIKWIPLSRARRKPPAYVFAFLRPPQLSTCMPWGTRTFPTFYFPSNLDVPDIVHLPDLGKSTNSIRKLSHEFIYR